MNPNERSSHPTRAQIEALLDFLERNPSLAKGFSKVASARDAARRHWERLAVQLNSMGGSSKSWKQWTKYWADKKSAVKKKAALRSVARRRTGGGMEEVVELTVVEERILCIMGGESFAIGDRHLAIHPFSEPQVSIEEQSTLPESVPHLSSLRETASHTLNTIPDTDCVPGTSYPSARQSYIPDVSTQTLPSSASPPRTPPILIEHRVQTTPSRHGVYPIRVSPSPLQHSRDSPPPSQPPLHTTTPRRRRRALIPPSPPSQRRSQLNSITDRFLRLEEQRLQLDRQNTDVLEAIARMVANQMERLSETNSAIAQALNSIGEGLKMLSERR